ncbi:MAG TPA: LEA type 2 family protein [Candidatus Saccharicenans sp.]|nr:LEA type 2 family protein [Candidatus Saccharicenans sp.]HRD02212.1 LEA type 2 family protein [Candidatus Saccharicenans sp.]
MAASAARNLVISLQEKKITELSPEGLTLSFYPAIKNNSDRNYVLISYFYRVMINGQNFFEQQVSLDESVTIFSRQSISLLFPVKISYQYLPAALSERQQQANCLVTGEMFFRNEKNKVEKAPFTFSMEFPIFKLPDIIFLPLAVKDLTLGGAEFTFSFQLKNPNPYDLLIKDLRLELCLGNRLIYQGGLAGDKALEPGGVKTFHLPLMLDFFEMGRELRDDLEKELVPFILKAHITADSAWGLLPFGLEKSDSVKKEQVH